MTLLHICLVSSWQKKRIGYKKKVELYTLWKTQNQHQNNHTGKGLIRLSNYQIKIHQTTSPPQRPRSNQERAKLHKRANTCSEQQPKIQKKTIPEIVTRNCPLPYPNFKVNNFNEIKQHLEEKVKFRVGCLLQVFRAHCILQSYTEWSALTSNTEVLQTVKGMHINIVSSLPNKKSFQYSLNEVETEFVRQARSTKSARKKSQCSHKVWACGTYITHLCQAQKRWWNEAHFKHEIFKQVCTIQGIQDGYSQLHSSFSKT